MTNKRCIFTLISIMSTISIISSCSTPSSTDDTNSSPLPSAAVATPGNTNTAAPGNNQISESDSRLILGENVLYAENFPPELSIRSGETVSIISSKDEYPSKPVISPNARKVTYIAPFEFEMAGEIWLYDSHQNKPDKVLSEDDFPPDKSPNRLYWIDDEHLLISIGNKYGTINSTRQLLVYSLNDKRLEEKVVLETHQHISDLTITSTGIDLVIQTYDSNFEKVVSTTDLHYPIERFL